MKKLIILFLSVIFLISGAFCLPANAAFDSAMEKLDLYSDTVYLVSTDNGTVLFDKNSDRQTAPASLTKITTAIVVLENCDDLDAVITVPSYCIEMLKGTGSSMAGLKADEEISIHNLLRCLLIASANEAALILADHVGGGDIDKFVTMMNETAKRLGCTDTHYVNPHGLDDDYQYTTARDVAILAAHAMETYPAFTEIVSRVTYQIESTNMHPDGLKLHNTNYMLNAAYKDYYCNYVSGIKTGSTDNAGKCVVASISKNGYSYIGVVMNAPFEDIDNDNYDENCAFVDCKEMFEWAIRNIELVKISDPDDIVAEIPVRHSWTTDHVTLSPAEELYELVPSGVDTGSLLIEPVDGAYPEFINAPLRKGDVVCRANVLYAGDIVAEIDLVANESIGRSIILLIGSYIKRAASSVIFKIVAVLAALAVLAYIVLIFFKNKKVKPRGKVGVATYKDYRNNNKKR